MRAYDWIVFDSTGTLMTPDPEPAGIYFEVARRRGSRLPLAQIRQNLKTALQRHYSGQAAMVPCDEGFERERWQRIVGDTLPDLATEETSASFAELWDRFATAECWRLFEDALPTIERLRSAGYRIAIASNFDERLSQILVEMDIVSCFDHVLISSQIGWSKPNPRFYQIAQQRVGVSDPRRIMMVGDTFAGDVQGPLDAGWDARHLVRESENGLRELLEDLIG